ncbi:MAG: hypothetical protein WA478_16230, partial [Pseudolabrys sp.]
MCPADTIREHIYAEKLRQLRQQLSETFDEVERSEILRQVEEVEAEIERTRSGLTDLAQWRDLRYWHKEDIGLRGDNVCFGGRAALALA